MSRSDRTIERVEKALYLVNRVLLIFIFAAIPLPIVIMLAVLYMEERKINRDIRLIEQILIGIYTVYKNANTLFTRMLRTTTDLVMIF